MHVHICTQSVTTNPLRRANLTSAHTSNVVKSRNHPKRETVMGGDLITYQLIKTIAVKQTEIAYQLPWRCQFAVLKNYKRNSKRFIKLLNAN